MNLSLTEAERVHLAALGVAAGSDGTLRSASGRPVDAGTAVVLLSKAAISPADFRRAPLLDGHAAHSAAQWTTGSPGQALMARPGPAGPAGAAGSGTADRDMGDDEGLDLVAGNDIDGSGVGPPDEVAKMTPAAFRRHYLAAGHSAESLANTGMRATTAVSDSAPAEPQDFRRGWLQPGHQDADPANDPMGNNPHPGGTPGAVVYRTAAEQYGANQARLAAEHLMPSQHITAEPAPSRPVMLPADMRASTVPVSVQAQATRPAPGEMR